MVVFALERISFSMSRKTTLQAPPVDEPAFTVSAMIDVSFLLLIFFLVTSTLHKEESDLGVKFPGHEGHGSVTIDFFEVTIAADGAIVVYGETLDRDPAKRSLPRLRDWLRDYKRAANLSGDKPLVVVLADDNADTQRLVDVLNCLAEVGIPDVTLPGFKES
jgi:biopolymer transport protein ExbD